MKIAIVDTYYAAFLAAHYQASPDLAGQPYETQLEALTASLFGTSDFYSRHLRTMGHEAIDIIGNCVPLQGEWAKRNNVALSELALKVHPRLFRVPVLGRWLASLPGLLDIVVAQIKAFRPDVLYCQDLSFIPPAAMAEIRKSCRLVVGQIACPLPPKPFLAHYDLILTSFPHFVDRLRAMGVGAEYLRIGFDRRVLERLGPVEKNMPLTFVGGISRHHDRAVPLLERLAEEADMQFFGYGAASLDASSPIRRRHHGEVWGLDMYRALARSNVTANRHINVAENNANNMRLYEATGVGAMLLTDKKDNLGSLFDIGREVVAYESPDEAVEMARYFSTHPAEAQEIAMAGQARTLREHTYEHRMTELVPILERWLGGRSA